MTGKTVKRYFELALLAAVIWAAILILYSWYSDKSNTHLGSFEYVRKAEDSIARSDFKGAIDLLEKAYSASPDNLAICSKLRNIYLDYGQSLAESGKMDNAISCMLRAYTVMPGASSAQRLAYVYAEKASERLISGDIAAARTSFENALTTAAPYASSSRNLGVFLFNKAVEEYKSGKNTTAIIFLKESSLAYKNPFTLELMGDIYYNRSDFDQARFYYGKSFELDPKNISTRNKLKRASMDLRLAKDRKTADTPHFSITYSDSMPLDTDFVLGVLEKCYFDIGSDLKYYPDSKTQIIFYSQDEFTKMFMMSSGTRAIYDGNIRVPLPPKKLNADELAQYLRHEYVHAVVSAKTNNNCPAWLNEGLAVWEVYKDRSDKMSRAMVEKLKAQDFSMDRLRKAFDLKNETEGDLRTDYLLSYSAVKYVIDAWGLTGLNRILDRIKSGEHFINAIDDEFLLSETEFDRRWRASSIKAQN
jgi:tetratricopeptide (TPR) repeat protein